MGTRAQTKRIEIQEIFDDIIHEAGKMVGEPDSLERRMIMLRVNTYLKDVAVAVSRLRTDYDLQVDRLRKLKRKYAIQSGKDRVDE
jgi:hypothetical protein